MDARTNAPRPTIARIWRGRVPRDRADEYARYLYKEGIPPLEEKALGVQMLREDRETESEFVTISYWESVAAMSRFAGDDPTRIHHLDRDPEFLIELPRAVQVLTIVASNLPVGGDDGTSPAATGVLPTADRRPPTASPDVLCCGRDAKLLCHDPPE